MCLLLLSYQDHPDVSLLLAGNRDEFKSRPSAPPALIGQEPIIFAGKDLEAGGTWMGRNDAGMMAALTNRHCKKTVPEGVLSRGGIVMELLRYGNPAAAAEWLARLPVELYRPFNVLFGSRESFYYFTSEDRDDPRILPPGQYALSNSTLNDSSWPKVKRSLEFLKETRPLGGMKMLIELQIFLADATPPDQIESDGLGEEIHDALGAVFIKHPVYGTVSSTILTSGGSLGERYYFAEGEEMERDAEGAYRLIQLSG